MSKVRHVLGISGGKDSAALAIYLKRLYPQLPIEYYNTDTKCELAETEKLIENLKSYLGYIKILVAAEDSPEPTPFDHFLKISGGYLPSPQARWCTQKMKLAEFERFAPDRKNMFSASLHTCNYTRIKSALWRMKPVPYPHSDRTRTGG